MRNLEELKLLIPKSKGDTASIPILESLEHSELEQIAKELLEWTIDSNWPIARLLCSILIPLGHSLVPRIREILKTRDDEWVWHIMAPLVGRLDLEVQAALIPNFLEYMRCEHGREYDEVVEEFLRSYAGRKYGESFETANGENQDIPITGDDILVEISYLPTDHGGRVNPVRTGYRPQFYYENHDWDASHNYFEVETVNPGETTRAAITFLSPDRHLGKLKPGSHFLIREGQKVCGYGHVVEILNLEFSAIRAALYRLAREKEYPKKD